MSSHTAGESAETAIHESRKYPGLQGRDKTLLKIAEARIQACIAGKGTKLDLDNLQLTSLPSELGECTSLKELFCGGNNLVGLPAELGQCASLDELVIINNKLEGLPVELAKCTLLEELYLVGNPLWLERDLWTMEALRARWEHERPHTKSAAKR